MSASELNELSLWLEPQGEAFKYINSAIKSLSKDADLASLVPHVTLLANIPFSVQKIETRLNTIAHLTPSFEITFKKISFSDEYFKSFFIECDEILPLVDLNKRLQEMFALNRPFLPHMSLIYGTPTLSWKEAKIKEIEKKEIKSFSFEATKISLWHAIGCVENWKKLAEFPLMFTHKIK